MNSNVVELLNLALEASADLPIFRRDKKVGFGRTINGVTKHSHGLSVISDESGGPRDSGLNRSLDDEMVVG